MANPSRRHLAMVGLRLMYGIGVPSGQDARVVLDIDSDHYSCPSIGNISPRSGMTAEEEYIIANRGRSSRENISMGGSLTTHLSSEGNLDSHDDSISNYNDSVSSTDIFSLPKSEIDGHASDSDISDNGGTFHATFEPRTNDDEENDSGITLVSYQNKESPHHRDELLYGTSSMLSARSSGDQVLAMSPRIAELQQKGSLSSSPGLSPTPLPPSIASERISGRDGESGNTGEGWLSDNVQRAHCHGSTIAATGTGSGPYQLKDAQINVIADTSGSLIYDSSWEPKCGEPPSEHVVLQSHRTNPGQAQNYTMDPITGLKRTGVVSPTDKAMVFMHATEPIIRVKKREDGINPAVEQERKNILEEMKVRTKKAETWLPEDEMSRSEEKTESERAYEERKIYLKEQGEKYSVVQPQEHAPNYHVMQKPKKPGEYRGITLNRGGSRISLMLGRKEV